MIGLSSLRSCLVNDECLKVFRILFLVSLFLSEVHERLVSAILAGSAAELVSAIMI